MAEKRSIGFCLMILIASSLSIGALYLPSLIKLTGLIMGSLTLLLAGGLSMLSLKVVSQVTLETGADNYGALIYYTFYREINESLQNGLVTNINKNKKKKFNIPRIFDFFLFLDCILCLSIFLIVLSELIPPIFSILESSSYHFFMFKSKSGLISLFSLLFFSLCLPKTCYQWNKVIYLASFTLLYILLNVYYQFYINLINSNKDFGLYIMPNSGTYNIYFSLMLFNACIFTFFAQFNLVQCINMLENPTVYTTRFIIAIFGIIVTSLYFSMGTLSYFMFGSGTSEFILNNFSPDKTRNLIARALLAISLFFIIPLYIYPMIESLTNCIINDYANNLVIDSSKDDHTNNTPLIDSNSSFIDKHKKKNSSKMSIANYNFKSDHFLKQKSGRSLLLALSLIIACFISISFQNKNFLLIILNAGFVDSIFMFLFPAYMHYYILSKKQGKILQSPTRLLLFVGFFISQLTSLTVILRQFLNNLAF